MTRLRIVPLDDAVVLPGMSVTLPIDVGGDAQVLLIPRRQTAYAKVGVVAEVTGRGRLPGHGGAVSLVALHRAVPGVAAADPDGVLRVEAEERPDQAPPASLTRELERDYRAVVEEILGLRGDDGRISAFVRSITAARCPGRYGRLFARSERRAEDSAPGDTRRRPAPEAGGEVPAGSPHRARGPQADP